MIPARFEPMVFALVLSGVMSLLVSGISTWQAGHPGAGFAGVWLASWFTGWLFAFPVLLVVAPLARRVVRRLVDQDR